jgi:hypothetical protein
MHVSQVASTCLSASELPTGPLSATEQPTGLYMSIFITTSKFVINHKKILLKKINADHELVLGPASLVSFHLAPCAAPLEPAAATGEFLSKPKHPAMIPSEQ